MLIQKHRSPGTTSGADIQPLFPSDDIYGVTLCGHCKGFNFLFPFLIFFKTSSGSEPSEVGTQRVVACGDVSDSVENGEI